MVKDRYFLSEFRRPLFVHDLLNCGAQAKVLEAFAWFGLTLSGSAIHGKEKEVSPTVTRK